jgi:hypothetical protein
VQREERCEDLLQFLLFGLCDRQPAEPLGAPPRVAKVRRELWRDAVREIVDAIGQPDDRARVRRYRVRSRVGWRVDAQQGRVFAHIVESTERPVGARRLELDRDGGRQISFAARRRKRIEVIRHSRADQAQLAVRRDVQRSQASEDAVLAQQQDPQRSAPEHVPPRKQPRRVLERRAVLHRAPERFPLRAQCVQRFPRPHALNDEGAAGVSRLRDCSSIHS